MQSSENTQLVDLGDAVSETKGSSMVGVADPLGGFRKAAGLSNDD